jgi:hypothetical protein
VAKSKKTDEAVAIEQRKQERRTAERRTGTAAVAVERRVMQRREKVNRRRQIDPTTCEREYTDVEIEFMHALDRYKRSSGRMFHTCSEILEVIRGLGYVKIDQPAPTETREEEPCFAQHC